ncbi:phage tail protein I, partial [Salmonella enterica subsp. enterica serovar London]|nr:phage tail protein I [Salmonella enterica subsp. enterica serovar London]
PEVQQTKPLYLRPGQWSLDITSIYPE